MKLLSGLALVARNRDEIGLHDMDEIMDVSATQTKKNIF